MKIDEIWTNTLAFLGQAWWVEVLTTQPRCTYYFGPFSGVESANRAVSGYVEDLEGESAQGIKTQVKRCHPERITILHGRGFCAGRGYANANEHDLDV